jgi:hypothetical protein
MNAPILEEKTFVQEGFIVNVDGEILGITQAIKVTESILKSEIPDDKTALLMEDAELRQIAGFELIPAGESVKIETVKAGKE